MAGRVAILELHATGLPLGADVDLDKVAGITLGSSGADLANVLNEAALLAARRGTTEELCLAPLGRPPNPHRRHQAAPRRLENHPASGGSQAASAGLRPAVPSGEPSHAPNWRSRTNSRTDGSAG